MTMFPLVEERYWKIDFDEIIKKILQYDQLVMDKITFNKSFNYINCFTIYDRQNTVIKVLKPIHNIKYLKKDMDQHYFQ